MKGGLNALLARAGRNGPALLCGNRNVTLVWAAAAPLLAGHPGVELYLAMAVFPIFMLPVAMRLPVEFLLRGCADGNAPAAATASR